MYISMLMWDSDAYASYDAMHMRLDAYRKIWDE